MKARVYNLFFLSIVLVVSIVSIFIFDLNLDYQVIAPEGQAVYYTSKVLAVLLLLAVMFFQFKTTNSRSTFMLSVLAVIYQFLPLGIRFLSLGAAPDVVLPWMLLLILTVGIIGFILAFEYVALKEESEK